MSRRSKIQAISVAFLAMTAGLFAETLEDARLKIVFGEASDGFAVRRIESRAQTTVAFLSSDASSATFWRLAFWKDGRAAEKSTLDNRSSARTRRVERTDSGLTFVWDGLDLPDEPNAVTVRATVTLTDVGTSRWHLEVQNASTAWGLAETTFPVFRQVSASGAADVLRPRPDFGAALEKARAWSDRDLVYGCMAYYPMMCAFLKDSAGLYFAAHDSEARIKSLTIGRTHDVSFTTPVENAGLAGKAAEGPRYDVTVAAFAGDWWAAARLYRAWALTTKWTAKGPIVARTDYPKRLAEIPLWLNIHAGPAETSNVMARVRRIFPNVDAGIHWHLWQHSPHDVNYPEYFPAQPGTEGCFAFCKAIGAEAMPYTNGRLWSNTTVGFAYAKPFAITGPDGAPVVERYGPVTPPLSPMCPYTPQWDVTLNDFAQRILDLGAGSLFLDQIGACAGQACHAADHGHPVGGGAWYFEGYQRILAQTHARYAATNAFLTTEGSGEQWMNVVDGYLNVTQRQVTDVPFFHAVYGGYTTYFCSPENHEDDDLSFRAAQTRELLWGQALGWYHPRILDNSAKCAIVRQLVEFRQTHKDFFAYGTLLGEVGFSGSVPEIDVTWLGRKPFWAWNFPDYPLSPTIRGRLPGVMGYVWRSTTDGRMCVFLANVTARPQTVTWQWQGTARTQTLLPGEIDAEILPPPPPLKNQELTMFASRNFRL